MGDEKLPARQPNVPLEQPPTGGSILGRLKSAFRSRLNTGTIIDNTVEAEAYRLYMEEMERLAEAIEKKERAVGKLVDDLPGFIQDDRAEHRTQMELNQLSRDRRLREAKERDELAALEHQAKVIEGKQAAARAQWGHDAFNQSLPHRQERIDHLYKSGALDAELQAVLLDKKISKLAGNENADTPSTSTVYEKLLKLLDVQAELACANQASQEVQDEYNELRAKIRVMIEAEKNRSG